MSVIARPYDPLGFLGPVLTRVKILLQNLDWDDVLPDPIVEEWREFVTTFKCIENVKINRFILTDTWLGSVLQGFSEFSKAAYGTIVYLQCFHQNDRAKVTILANKSRVAPIRAISIPRLELCACVLLTQLMRKIRSCIKLEISDIVLHTESTIALM
ncbi:integrase catalytic domain-containing protein [Trichonephila clavipes]|nr:integrase catalytic domain-containing protein [Trichonephila clavipes]